MEMPHEFIIVRWHLEFHHREQNRTRVEGAGIKISGIAEIPRHVSAFFETVYNSWC